MNERGDAMKHIVRIIFFFLMVGSAYGQSNLPACPSSGYFDNCFGSLTFASGNKYVGEWKDDKKNGQGTETLADGSKYVGEYKDGRWNGQGTYNYVRGAEYVGEWKDGSRNGQGTFTIANGTKFVGEFKDNNFHGYGTLYTSTGSIISQGIWADNKLVRSASVQQATVPNQENERLRAEASEAKRQQAESEEKVSITEQQIPKTNDLRSRNLAINWRLETFGGNLGNSYCQASNITYNGRNTNDGSAIFWVVVDCRTSRAGSSGGHYRFCGINHQEIMRQTGFTSVCRKN